MEKLEVEEEKGGEGEKERKSKQESSFFHL